MSNHIKADECWILFFINGETKSMVLLGIISFFLLIFNLITISILRSFYNDLLNLNKSYYSEKRKFNMTCFGCIKTETGINEYIKDNGYKRIAIYGVGAIFNVFKRELCSAENAEIICYIDQNDKREKMGNVDVIRLEQLNMDKDIDLVIVTVVNGYEKVKEKLEERTNAKIANIEELIYW